MSSSTLDGIHAMPPWNTQDCRGSLGNDDRAKDRAVTGWGVGKRPMAAAPHDQAATEELVLRKLRAYGFAKAATQLESQRRRCSELLGSSPICPRLPERVAGEVHRVSSSVWWGSITVCLSLTSFWGQSRTLRLLVFLFRCWLLNLCTGVVGSVSRERKSLVAQHI